MTREDLIAQWMHSGDKFARNGTLYATDVKLLCNQHMIKHYYHSHWGTSNSSSKTRGAAAPCTWITWVSFVGSEEPSLKILRLTELLRANSSPISNYQRSKSGIFLLRYINYNINSLLRLRVGTRIIYLSIYRTSITYQKSKWKKYRGCLQQPLKINSHAKEERSNRPRKRLQHQKSEQYPYCTKGLQLNYLKNPCAPFISIHNQNTYLWESSNSTWITENLQKRCNIRNDGLAAHVLHNTLRNNYSNVTLNGG